MASNVADLWLWFPNTARTTTAGVTTGVTVGVIQRYPLPSRMQVKQFGIIISVDFPTFTASPVIQLQKVNGNDYGTTTALATLTLGPTAATFKTTFNHSAVAAGGPGTVVTQPTLSPGTLAVIADFAAGSVLVGPDDVLPSVMFEAGEYLQVAVTTQGTTAGTDGQYNAFVRLEVAGEQALEIPTVLQQME